MKQKKIESITANNIQQSIIQQNIFTGRIESVQDRETNNRLFSTYANLINPVKQIEDRVNEVEDLYAQESRLYDIYDTDFIWRGLWIGIILSIISAVLYTKNESYRIMTNWYYGIPDRMTPPEGLAAQLALAFAFIFAPTLLVILIGIILGFVEKSMRVARNNGKRKKIHVRTEQLKNEILQITSGIASNVCFVPPKYRTSDALSFFVSAYENSQVDDLKEAVNAYNEQLKHREMMGALQGICTTLADIQYVQMKLFS